MQDRLTTLPDELLLHIFDTPSALVRLGLLSRNGNRILKDKKTWISFCEKHPILCQLMDATVGMSALQEGSLDARELYLRYLSKNKEAIKDLFSPQQIMMVYYPNFESNVYARAHVLQFSNERKFYLSEESARKVIPNISSVKCFLRCALPVSVVRFASLSQGVVISSQPIQSHPHAEPSTDALWVLSTRTSA
jgi:hypothetical protein